MLDANTFSNQNVAQKLNENFINIKIDAETKYGQQLFANFSGTGYPLILFLDSDKSEIDCSSDLKIKRFGNTQLTFWRKI